MSNIIPLHRGVRPLPLQTLALGDPEQAERMLGGGEFPPIEAAPMFTADELIFACWLSGFAGVIVTLGAAYVWSFFL